MGTIRLMIYQKETFSGTKNASANVFMNPDNVQKFPKLCVCGQDGADNSVPCAGFCISKVEWLTIAFSP